MKDYYSILGLPRSAGPDSVNDAKRRLSFLYHPDTRARDMDPRFADERIREVNEAWETLSDPNRRAIYDRETKPVAGARSALPILSVVPSVVELAGIDAKGTLRFSVQISQTAGPPFDPALHRFEFGRAAPWDRADVRYDVNGKTSVPMTLTFEIDLARGGFLPDTDYVGDFTVNAVLRS